MRVLFLTHRLPYPPNRGDRIRAYHLLKALAGISEVSLISLVHDDHERADAASLAGIAARVETAMVTPWRNRARAALALLTRTPLTHVLLDSPDMPRLLNDVVASSRPDVVVSYCSGMAQYAMRAPLHDIPFVLDFVDMDSAKWTLLGQLAPWPLSAIYRREGVQLRRFEGDAAQQAAVVTVVNQRELDILTTITTSSRAVVVQNGVDVDRYRVGNAARVEGTVVFCGVFDYPPNEQGAMWLAREVWPLVRQARPDARLLLVGMNPTARVRALSEDPSITVTGAVPDVVPYLAESVVAAAPLLVARGLQNKVLEAVAADLPTVVTPAVMEGLPQTVRSACRAAAEPAAFAAAVVRFLEMSPAERLETVASADLDSLRWDRQLVAFLNVVQQAAATTRAGR